MSYLANILAEKLLKYSLIDSDIKENYEYVIQVHLEQIIGFFILLTISMLCGFLGETIIFIIFFSHQFTTFINEILVAQSVVLKHS